MNDAYISEFLFRGRCRTNEADKSPDFSVTITRWTNDLAGNARPESYGPVTSTRAKELGYDLTSILEEINAEAIFGFEEATKRSEAMLHTIEALETQVADLTAKLAEAQKGSGK